MRSGRKRAMSWRAQRQRVGGGWVGASGGQGRPEGPSGGGHVACPAPRGCTTSYADLSLPQHCEAGKAAAQAGGGGGRAPHFDQPKKHVGVQRALVRLVHHHAAAGAGGRAGRQVGARQQWPAAQGWAGLGCGDWQQSSHFPQLPPNQARNTAAPLLRDCSQRRQSILLTPRKLQPYKPPSLCHSPRTCRRRGRARPGTRAAACRLRGAWAGGRAAGPMGCWAHLSHSGHWRQSEHCHAGRTHMPACLAALARNIY